MAEKIELLKIRDFGEIIGDVFIFFRQNFGPVMKCFFIFCGFFLIGGALFSALQQIKMFGAISDVRMMAPRPGLFGGSDFFSRIFTPNYFIALAFLLLASLTLQTTLISYMALYKEKGNQTPTTAEIWGYLRYFFLRIVGSFVVITLLLGVPICLLIYFSATSLPVGITVLLVLGCLVLLVYLYPILGLVFPVMIFENTSLGYAYSRSRTLIRDNWWSTFGALVVMIIIVYVASIIMVLPVSIITGISSGLHIAHGEHISITLVIITAIIQSLNHVFYIFPVITISLCYFNLTEQLDAPGLLGRIGQLGTNITESPDEAPSEEEY